MRFLELTDRETPGRLGTPSRRVQSTHQEVRQGADTARAALLVLRPPQADLE